MAERVQHTYICQCKGHAEGSTSFFAAPPEWFKSRGYNTPVWCPPCRTWRNAQVDEATRCVECGEGIRLPRKYKISVHKKEGPYKRPEKCKLCASGKRKAKAPRVARHEPKKVVDENFENLLPPTINTEIQLVMEVSDYQRVRGQDGETDQVHIEHHIDGHDESQVGQTLKGRTKPQSATSLVGAGATFVDLLIEADRVARHTAETQVRQYESRGHILKVTPGHPGCVEIVVINSDGSPMGPKLVTAYDGEPLADFAAWVQSKSV